MTSGSTVTPMMAQYLEIKAGYPDALLFYRMGDFYELFFEDAVAASAALEITLTKRGKHEGEDIAMCGVPVHAAEGYLLTLIRKGFRVAIGEQMESPAEAKKRGSKSVVKRAVVRLVTPGTLSEDSLLSARQNNFLAAYQAVRDEGALAWLDMSTGEIGTMVCSAGRLSPELARLAPKELLVREGIDGQFVDVADDLGIALTHLAPSALDSQNAEKRLLETYGVSDLAGFGQFSRAQLGALGGLLSYLEITQIDARPTLKPPVSQSGDEVMQIDAATRRNLEITQNLSGGRDNTLLSSLDRTTTSGGGRLLSRRLAAPSMDVAALQARLDRVEIFADDNVGRADIRAHLRRFPDLERALSRVSLDRAGPRDLAAFRDGLKVAEELQTQADDSARDDLVAICDASSSLRDHLSAALIDEPPLLARDGGFLREGFDSDLDTARQLRDEGRSVIAGLQNQYSELTEIPSLKVKHNNVLGYFIEVTSTHSAKMLAEPLSATFIHRQTTANATRFTTVELSELERKILTAGHDALAIEKRHFAELCEAVLKMNATLYDLARTVSELDVAVANAERAVEGGWMRPKLDQSQVFEIKNGRHPVVEDALQKSGEGPFVANDCDLSKDADDAAIWLLTGPNMAGKSTFLRQNALIAILAQTGSFVPADAAHIGVVSQLFSRVGASDDLARGRSTFLVEMVETAAILNQADARALVILDEIGRGTATYDGLSIAWACLEQLHEVNKCRALFATHYHEMTQLSDTLEGVSNATVSVKEWEGEIIFLHEVRKGAADRSYGVQVAKLAGLPQTVIHRAQDILKALEKGSREGAGTPMAILDDLPLFSATATEPQPVMSSKLEDRLEAVSPDALTPREALDLIYELKALSET